MSNFKEISLDEFLELWIDGLMPEVIVTVDKGRTRLFGKSVKGQAENPKGFEAVEASVSSVSAVGP